MDRLYDTAPILIAFASAAALTLALVSQYGFGLEPCPLCLYQRVPYALAGAVCLAAVVLPRRRGPALAAAAALFAVGTGIAVYHVGVEQHWWASAVCDGGVPEIATGADLMAALQQKPEKACDEVDATLFGVSMATYNVAASAALALFAGLAWRHATQRTEAAR